MESRREFNLRRLHSLLGVLPIGLFLIEHLLVNYFATRGPEAFNKAAEFMHDLPFRLLMEIFVIYLPILFHAVLGLHIAFTAKYSVGSYSYFRNWMFALQRITGIVTVVFIVWHVWQTRVQVALGATANADMMVEIFSNPFMIAFYMVGVLSAIFHFANGLWSFALRWGLIVTPKSQRIFTYITLGVFVFLAFMSIRTLLAFINMA